MKSIGIISFLALTVVFFATPTFAGDSRLGGEISLGTMNNNVNDGLALQGYLEFDAQRDFALRYGISNLTGNTTVDILSDDEVTMFGIEAAALYKIKAKKAKPYIGAGIGYYMPKYELSDDVEASLAMLGVRGEDDLDSGVGFFLMGGVILPLSETASLGASVKYLILDVDDNAKVTDLATFQNFTNNEEVELSTLFLSVSLQIKF